MSLLFRIISIVAIGRSTTVRDPQWIVIGAGVSGVVILIRSIRKHRTVTRVLQSLSIVLLAWILVIVALVSYQRRYEQGEPLPSGPRQGEITIVDTRTDDVMIARTAGREYRYRTDELYPLGTRLWITGYVTDESLSLRRAPGKPITFQAVSGEMDRAGWLRMRGLHGTIKPSNSILQGYDDLPRYTQTKARLVDRVGELFDDRQQGLLLGMLIGDRSGFDDETYQGFIDSGLVHIIAVSGGNLVMIMVFLGLVLIRVPLRIRTVIMASAIIAYALVVGMDSSIFRAVIMALLTMMALLSGRIANIRRLMGIASLVMLWRNPYFLGQDIGFIFSYAALIGIVLIRPWIAKSSAQTRRLVWRQRLPHLVWADYILPTAGASLAVMPFLLLFTDSRNVLSLLANLLVLPIVPLVMIGGLIATIVSPRRGCTRLAHLIDRLLQYIVTVSDWIASHGRLISVQQRWFVVVLIAFLFIYAIATHRRGKRLEE